MKKVLKYIILFLLVLILLMSFLVITAKIPKEDVKGNIKESEICFRKADEIVRKFNIREYSHLDIYADSILLNITYCIDEMHPLSSVLEAKYYVKDLKYKAIDYDFEELVRKSPEPNMQYIRYWHGSVGIVRILLTFMNLWEIYILNAIVLSILTIILLILLFKKKAIALGVSFIIGLIMTFAIMVPFCLEYTWTFYIMLITSILTVKWKDDDKKINILFFITGMITCFFDFLSTEIITITVPLLILLILKIKDRKITNDKEALLFIVKSLFLWFIAYAFMWLAKWIISSIVLKIDAFNYVKWQAKRRINGGIAGIDQTELWMRAIERNVLTLYPLNLRKTISRPLSLIIVIVIFLLILIQRKNRKKIWILEAILLIGMLPYIRYALLSNHSYIHYFFTFRSQIVSIMAIVLIIIYSIEFLKEKIKSRRKKWN